MSAGVSAGRVYQVRAVQFEPVHREEVREVRAASLPEALAAEARTDGAGAGFTYGVCAEDYDEARAEGIAFNEADGLLVDAQPLLCRYGDCEEQHAVIVGDERVTCPTCRKALGLPALTGEAQP